MQSLLMLHAKIITGRPFRRWTLKNAGHQKKENEGDRGKTGRIKRKKSKVNGASKLLILNVISWPILFIKMSHHTKGHSSLLEYQKVKYQMLFNEFLNDSYAQDVGTTVLYCEVPGFKLRPWILLSWLRLCVFLQFFEVEVGTVTIQPRLFCTFFSNHYLWPSL